jgi:hypothetical protein
MNEAADRPQFGNAMFRIFTTRDHDKLGPRGSCVWKGTDYEQASKQWSKLARAWGNLFQMVWN